MNQKLSSLFVLGALTALGSQAALAAPDWSKVPTKTIPVIHPAVSPLEWVQSRDHSGASGLKKGETCAGCHNDGGKLDIDLKRLAGKEMEVGRYYYKQGSYLAGINRFKRVVTEYQNTSQTPEALYRLAEGYTALGVVSEAQTAAGCARSRPPARCSVGARPGSSSAPAR